MFANSAHPGCKLPIQGKGWAGMRGAISLQAVLEVASEFDECGGASVGLVAWELCVDEGASSRTRRKEEEDRLPQEGRPDLALTRRVQ